MTVVGILGATLLCAIHDATTNIFGTFNLTQAKETYTMTIANRFWFQIFGVAFFNKYWLHFFKLFVPLTGL